MHALRILARIVLHIMQALLLLSAVVGGVILLVSWITNEAIVSDIDETIMLVIICAVLSVAFSPMLWSSYRKGPVANTAAAAATQAPAGTAYGSGAAPAAQQPAYGPTASPAGQPQQPAYPPTGSPAAPLHQPGYGQPTPTPAPQSPAAAPPATPQTPGVYGSASAGTADHPPWQSPSR